MEPSAALNFQNNQIGYRFNNVDLLQEALTHSLESKQMNLGFPDQNRTYARLQVIGNAVLKFIASEHVLKTSPSSDDEGILTESKVPLVCGEMQAEVAKKMFQTRGGDLLPVLVRHQTAASVGRLEKFVRALLGAVYIDAGGASGNGLQSARTVFRKLWGRVTGNLEVGTSLLSKFSVTPDVLARMEQNGINSSYFQAIESRIGMKIEKCHLLGQAFIHRSFYEGGQKWGPDYQRLEFLGDCVLELIVTELLWMQHPPDESTGPLSENIRRKIEATGQRRVFNNLKLIQFVKVGKAQQGSGIAQWKSYDDVMESLIGAIYIDKGFVAVKKFVMENWELGDDPNRSKCDIETRLGYKFKDPRFLEAALLPMNGDCDDYELNKMHSVLTHFGRNWIKFHGTEHVLRTTTDFDDLDLLRASVASLCDPQACLQVEQRIKLAPGQHLYSLETLAGAIFKDMQEAKIKMAFGNIFYRLWNPILNTPPRKELTKTEYFLDGSEYLEDFEISDIEQLIGYTFKRKHFIQQAVDDDYIEFYSWMGDTLVDLVVSVYLTILMFMQADNFDEDTIPEQSVMQFHRSLKTECLKKVVKCYSPALREVRGTDRANMVRESNAILAAIYFDIEDYLNLSGDKAFSKWKDYFITEREFISSGTQVE